VLLTYKLQFGLAVVVLVELDDALLVKFWYGQHVRKTLQTQIEVGSGGAYV